MAVQKKRFLKNFTWQRFFKAFLLYFIVTLLFSVIVAYIFPGGETVADNFTTEDLIKRAVLSVLLGFVFAIWMKPAIHEEDSISSS